MIDYDYVVSKSQEFREENDCAVKALSIATDTPYEKVHEIFAKHGRKNNDGVPISIIHKVIDDLGYKIEKQQKLKKSITINKLGKILPLNDIFDNTFLFYTRNHVFTAKDRKIQDWTVGRRFKVIYAERIAKKELV